MKNTILYGWIGFLAVLSQVVVNGSILLQQKVHEDNTSSPVSKNAAINICNTLPNWSLVSHPNDCHRFYICANHVPEEMICPKNSIFNKDLNRCIKGSLCVMHGGGEEIKDICRISSSSNSWAHYVDGDCHAFDYCKNGRNIREYCANGRYFDRSLRMCLPIADTPQHKCSCLLPDQSILKNPSNCASYYVCTNGRAILKRCPKKGYFFNTQLNTCVVDFNGICHTNGPPRMLNAAHGEEEAENAIMENCKRMRLRNTHDNGKEEMLILQPDINDCTKFYMCINEERVVTKYCPKGFYFNRDIHYCEEDVNDVACAAIKEQAQKKSKEEEKETEMNDSAAATDDDDEKQSNPDIFSSINEQRHESSAANVVLVAPVDQEKEEEIANNSAEVEIFKETAMKLPPRPPTQQQSFKKFSSKFMVF